MLFFSPDSRPGCDRGDQDVLIFRFPTLTWYLFRFFAAEVRREAIDTHSLRVQPCIERTPCSCGSRRVSA